MRIRKIRDKKRGNGKCLNAKNCKVITFLVLGSILKGILKVTMEMDWLLMGQDGHNLPFEKIRPSNQNINPRKFQKLLSNGRYERRKESSKEHGQTTVSKELQFPRNYSSVGIRSWVEWERIISKEKGNVERILKVTKYI